MHETIVSNVNWLSFVEIYTEYLGYCLISAASNYTLSIYLNNFVISMAKLLSISDLQNIVAVKTHCDIMEA